jgi:hypothetical protein
MMNYFIKHYPLILLVIILVNIILACRKETSSFLRSITNFLYLKKFQRYIPVTRGAVDIEGKYAARFGLFAGSYLLVFAIFSLHYFGYTPFNHRFTMNHYKPKPGFETLYQIKEDIPKDASVSVPSDIGVLLCERIKVYLFPNIKDAEYIVFDINHENAHDYWDLRQVAEVLKTGEYGIYKKRGRFVILKKGISLDGVDEMINKIRKRSH